MSTMQGFTSMCLTPLEPRDVRFSAPKAVCFVVFITFFFPHIQLFTKYQCMCLCISVLTVNKLLVQAMGLSSSFEQANFAPSPVQCIMGRIRPIRLCKLTNAWLSPWRPYVMRVHGPNTLRKRQCGPVVRALALRSGDPGFKTRSDHSLNLILVDPGSTSQLHL